MHIILVSDRLATARTLTITPRVLAAMVLVFFVLVFATSFAFSWLSLHFRLPFVQQMIVAVQQHEAQKTQEFVRDNLDAMAARLGQMQAQLLRLDSLGERLSTLAGVRGGERPTERSGARSGDAPVDRPAGDGATAGGGSGGPLRFPEGGLRSVAELQRELDRLALHVEFRGDALSALEARLMDERLKRSMLPTVLPIEANYIGSSFGTRIDPIAGIRAMHEGIDFVADIGTPVSAAASGVVVTVEQHPEYGHLVEIDHGNDFSTRYAHLSRTLVRPGQVVKRGQQIAASGNSGRSTGPHLHFEVRYRGVPQNPARFLRQDSQALARLGAR